MKKIVIGGLAVLIGVTGVSQFFVSVLDLILGALPILLILGGALAFYLGFTDVQEQKNQNPPTEPEPHTKSDHKETDTAPPATTAAETPPAQNTPNAVSPETDTPLFKGNFETLIFHSIACNFSQGKKCTMEFATREEAVEQGYTPCKVCSP